MGVNFDNTYPLALYNIRQLNFRHFNTNSKKFTVTVNFIQKETKSAPKLSESSPKSIRMFPIISEDFRRLPKISEENSENVLTIYQGQTVHSSLKQGKDVSKKPSEKPSKH